MNLSLMDGGTKRLVITPGQLIILLTSCVGFPFLFHYIGATYQLQNFYEALDIAVTNSAIRYGIVGVAMGMAYVSLQAIFEDLYPDIARPILKGLMVGIIIEAFVAFPTPWFLEVMLAFVIFLVTVDRLLWFAGGEWEKPHQNRYLHVTKIREEP